MPVAPSLSLMLFMQHVPTTPNWSWTVYCRWIQPLLTPRSGSLHTPLMIAAEEAASRSSIHKLPETILIDALLAAGANKQVEDPSRLTAYGHSRKR